MPITLLRRHFQDAHTPARAPTASSTPVLACWCYLTGRCRRRRAVGALGAGLPEEAATTGRATRTTLGRARGRRAVAALATVAAVTDDAGPVTAVAAVAAGRVSRARGGITANATAAGLTVLGA